jgi:hypothetical protein
MNNPLVIVTIRYSTAAAAAAILMHYSNSIFM